MKLSFVWSRPFMRVEVLHPAPSPVWPAVSTYHASALPDHHECCRREPSRPVLSAFFLMLAFLIPDASSPCCESLIAHVHCRSGFGGPRAVVMSEIVLSPRTSFTFVRVLLPIKNVCTATVLSPWGDIMVFGNKAHASEGMGRKLGSGPEQGHSAAGADRPPNSRPVRASSRARPHGGACLWWVSLGAARCASVDRREGCL